jgi:hypothetical protein
MVWAVLWSLLLAGGLGILLAWISDRPSWAARPVLTGALMGVGAFLVFSTCVPVWAVVVPLTWNQEEIMLWEGGAAVPFGALIGSATARICSTLPGRRPGPGVSWLQSQCSPIVIFTAARGTAGCS